MEVDRSRRQLLISVGLVFLLIVLLLALVDIGAVVDMLILADKRMLLLAAFFLLLGYGLITVRTRYLLKNKTGYLETLKVDGSGFMFSILIQLPNSIYRVIALDRTTSVKASQATSMVFLEFLLTFILRMVALALFVGFAAAEQRDAERPLLIGILTVVFLLVILFILASRAEQLQPRLADGLEHLPRIDEERAQRFSTGFFSVFTRIGSPWRFFVALLISLVYWVSALLFFFLVLSAFDLDQSISYPTVALVTVFFVPTSSPLMVGVFHGVLIAPLVMLNLMETEVATA
jgi:uncharacterized membrane protein YbhN (UPF0104 family)